MNKIETFSPTQITSVEAHLAWASLEVLADDVNELQVMAAGNDKDVSDLRIQEKEGRLVVEQPTYGLSIKLNSERWMQIVIRLPRSWKGALDMSTITAPLRARGISGTDVTLDSVSGDMRAANINAIALTLRQVSGGHSGPGSELRSCIRAHGVRQGSPIGGGLPDGQAQRRERRPAHGMAPAFLSGWM